MAEAWAAPTGRPRSVAPLMDTVPVVAKEVDMRAKESAMMGRGMRMMLVDSCVHGWALLKNCWKSDSSRKEEGYGLMGLTVELIQHV